MKRPLRGFQIALCTLALSGCNTAALKAAPNDAASLGGELHRQIDAEQWDAIYDAADSKYKDEVGKEKSAALFQAIHRKLGTVSKITMVTWQLQGTTNGTFLNAGFTTNYSTGAVSQDRFVWHRIDDGYRLVGWNINSDELILK